jgi:hypothetical protein
MARRKSKSLFDRLKSSLEEAEKFAEGELTLKTCGSFSATHLYA